MFGKLMSISDDLMWKYYTLLTDLSPAEIDQLRSGVTDGDLHPKQAKVDLAKRIVRDFHGAEEADRAAEEFDRRFTKGELPDDLPIIEVPESEWRVSIERMMVRCGLADSMSDARRKYLQGGVKINGQRLSSNLSEDFGRLEATEFTLQVGKRSAVRVRLIR
jgi:tyrosyl-tRNA synthetase